MPTSDVDTGRALVDGREDAQAAGDEQREQRERAPEDREDERIPRDVLERLEHQAVASP